MVVDTGIFLMDSLASKDGLTRRKSPGPEYELALARRTASLPGNWCKAHGKRMEFEEGWICWDCERNQAAAEERERCAKICETVAIEHYEQSRELEEEGLIEQGHDAFEQGLTCDLLAAKIRE